MKAMCATSAFVPRDSWPAEIRGPVEKVNAEGVGDALAGS